MDGSLGSNVMAKTGLAGRLEDLFTLCIAMFLGICLALLIAALMRDSLYPLEINISFNSSSLLSLEAGEEQILTILYAKEKGILSVTWAGWQELGSKY